MALHLKQVLNDLFSLKGYGTSLLSYMEDYLMRHYCIIECDGYVVFLIFTFTTERKGKLSNFSFTR